MSESEQRERAVVEEFGHTLQNKIKELLDSGRATADMLQALISVVEKLEDRDIVRRLRELATTPEAENEDESIFEFVKTLVEDVYEKGKVNINGCFFGNDADLKRRLGPQVSSSSGYSTITFGNTDLKFIQTEPDKNRRSSVIREAGSAISKYRQRLSSNSMVYNMFPGKDQSGQDVYEFHFINDSKDNGASARDYNFTMSVVVPKSIAERIVAFMNSNAGGEVLRGLPASLYEQFLVKKLDLTKDLKLGRLSPCTGNVHMDITPSLQKRVDNMISKWKTKIVETQKAPKPKA